MVHNETSTGIVNPIKEIGEISSEFDIPLMVDAVSSLGGMELKMDQWNIDICVTASQKCLESPPGLALIAISQKGWRTIEKHQDSRHGWYLNLRLWKKYSRERAGWHPYPVTMAVNNILALRAALKKILAEGLDKRVARHAQIAKIVRIGLKNIGFSLIADERCLSNTLTVALTIPGTSPEEIIKFLRTKYYIQIAGGVSNLKDKSLRIAHMGSGASLNSVIPVMFGIEDYLRSKGFKIPYGTSLRGV